MKYKALQTVLILFRSGFLVSKHQFWLADNVIKQRTLKIISIRYIFQRIDDLIFVVIFQEEEIDDLAGQVQLLEQSKLKLEMSMAAMKKEHRREVSVKVI